MNDLFSALQAATVAQPRAYGSHRPYSGRGACEVRWNDQEKALEVHTPFHQGFVADLKAQIPRQHRQWAKHLKAWLVSPDYSSTLQSIILRNYGREIEIPQIDWKATVATKILEVRYLGATRERDDGSNSATGHDGHSWGVIFPKKVLMEWFGQQERPADTKNLFSLLGVTESATEKELKKAHRRLARQWHPDICKEPDATAQFQKIQAAYDILADPGKRARYVAGLRLEARMGIPEEKPKGPIFRAPLRCGYIMAEVEEGMGVVTVLKILAWEDITDGQGRVLVSSWPEGAEMYQEDWVEA